MQKSTIKESAIATIALQAQAVTNLQNLLTDDFAEAVIAINKSAGRLVVSGIGKSAIVAQKIVATCNSTGTPALYMHAADAIHGDVGMLLPNDIIIIISKSGESEEIRVLSRLVKKFENLLIAITGNKESSLAKDATYVLDTYVAKEACPNNLAPTTSTTAQMVMGDALAIALLQIKGFTADDFAKFHPGGALGKQLFLHVHHLSSQNAQPKVNSSANIKDVIIAISSNRLGATAVVDEGKILGIITDGDIRRMMEHCNEFTNLQAKDIMNPNPKIIDENELAINALSLMRTNSIAQLLVVNKSEYKGFIHLHDLLKEGLV